ncbi:MAG: hypothetical protein KIS92_09275 [Planctomycetota bacterium]|nr:hypothetical protein [Planctomycetota bacterium]
MGRALAMFVGVGLLACASAHAATFVAGADETAGWNRTDLNGVRARKQPVLLYIYDSTVKTGNNTAQYFEVTLLGLGQKVPNPKVQEAVKDLYKVKVRADDLGFPETLTSKAVGSAALFVLTCDGTVVGGWWKNNQGTAVDFINACKMAVAANPTSVAKLEKTPPEKFERKRPEEKKTDAGPPEPEEKKPEKMGGIPGLGEEKTGAPPKKEEKKTQPGKLEDE